MVPGTAIRQDYGVALNRSQGDAGRLDDAHVVAKNLGNLVEKNEVLAIPEAKL
jgi:hypothetical protein